MSTSSDAKVVTLAKLFDPIGLAKTEHYSRIMRARNEAVGATRSELLSYGVLGVTQIKWIKSA